MLWCFSWGLCYVLCLVGLIPAIFGGAIRGLGGKCILIVHVFVGVDGCRCYLGYILKDSPEKLVLFPSCSPKNPDLQLATHLLKYKWSEVLLLTFS